MRRKALSRKTKITLYKTLILPLFPYGSESWTISASDAAALGVFERKILWRLFGPNFEQYELFKNKRLQWLGHDVRMSFTVPASNVFEGVANETGRRGATCLC